MSDLNKISRGEVYYISSYPTTGSEQRSGRPAVIVSNDMNNEYSSTVEICYMTLQEKTKLPTHVFVDRGACINSTILCEQVTTVSKERVGEYMCTLPDDILDAVDKALIVSLGLDYIIEQETNKSVSVAPSPAKEEIPSATLEEIDRLRDDLISSEAKNRELTVAIDHFKERAERSESLARESETYKKLYDELLDRIMRR